MCLPVTLSWSLPFLWMFLANQKAAAFSVPPSLFSPYDPYHRESFVGKRDISLSASLESCSPRRDFFRQVSSAIIILSTPTSSALALGEGEQRMALTQRPKAPIAALIPAVQQRLLLEECLALTTQSQQPTNAAHKNAKETLLRKLQAILSSLAEATPEKPRRLLNTSGNNKDLAVMIQYEPSKVLSGNLVRAAMNVYTANLNYYGNNDDNNNGNGNTNMAPPSYTVTDPDWKKSYIRANDGLPDVKRVIQADLDLRDLYRNQVQLKLEDASAELHYISGEATTTSVDTEELRLLLREAADAFDLWLGKIADEDVKNAIQAALEGKSLRVYNSYYAGFMPPSSTTAPVP